MRNIVLLALALSLLTGCVLDRSPFGPVPAGDAPRLTMRILLPWVGEHTASPLPHYPPSPCGTQRTAEADVRWAREFARLWLDADWQQRQGAVADARLVWAALKHADWLAAHNTCTHEGEGGLWPNDRVRAAGYRLPDSYPAGVNNVESLAVDWQGPAHWLERLYTSPSHHDHLAGIGMFGEQTRYGIGVCGAWLVLITAPPEPEG